MGIFNKMLTRKSGSEKMMDAIMNLKMTAKQFNSMSKRAAKEVKKEKKKAQKAIEARNVEHARIYAQNAIRKGNEATNFLRLSARIDATRSQLESAYKMNQVTKSMGSVVNILNHSMSNMSAEKVTKVMDEFEKKMEDVGVVTESVSSSMNNSSALTTPEDQVNDLLAQIVDENDLKFDMKTNKMTSENKIENQEAIHEESLQERLKKLNE